jgi:hypothetical protein
MPNDHSRYRSLITGALVGTLTALILSSSVLAPMIATWQGDFDKVLVYQKGLLIVTVPIGAMIGATVAVLAARRDG